MYLPRQGRLGVRGMGQGTFAGVLHNLNFCRPDFQKNLLSCISEAAHLAVLVICLPNNLGPISVLQ